MKNEQIGAAPIDQYYFPTSEISYPGVPRYRPYLGYIEHQSEFSSLDEQLLISVVQHVDQFLAWNSLYKPESLEPGSDSKMYFTILLEPETVEQLKHHCIQTAIELSMTHPDMEFVFPAAGAIPLASLAREHGLPASKIHVIDISGSVGTKTGSSSIRSPLPEEVLNPKQSVVMVEDITDSFSTVFALTNARKYTKMMSEEKTQNEWNTKLFSGYSNLIHFPETAWNPNRRLARICEEERVILLPVFTKDEIAINTIKDIADLGFSDWASQQSEALGRYSPYVLPNVWVLGGGLLDTAIPFQRILPYLPDDLQNDTKIKHLQKLGIVFRIGAGIPGLVYISGNQEEQIVELVARTFLNALYTE